MIIDLSISLDDNTPAYPGDPKIQITQTESIESEGYCGHSVLLGTHTGTHIDAPAHMIEGGKTLGQLPIENFSGIGKLVSGFSMAAIDEANVAEGDIVLFNTHTSSRLYDQSYFTDYPAMSEEVANYLVSKKVKLVGMDTCSADNTPDFVVHKKLLSNNIAIAENLTNLDALHAKEFLVYALPLKLDLDGAPSRVFAVTTGPA